MTTRIFLSKLVFFLGIGLIRILWTCSARAKDVLRTCHREYIRQTGDGQSSFLRVHSSDQHQQSTSKLISIAMDLAELNKISTKLYLETRPVKKLVVGKFYCINGIAKLDTRFGAKIKVTLKLEEDEFETFLPQRVCKFLFGNEAAYKTLEQSCGKVFLQVHGPNEIEFIEESALL